MIRIFSRMTSDRKKRFISVGICAMTLQAFLDEYGAEEFNTEAAKHKELLQFTVVAVDKVIACFRGDEERKFYHVVNRVDAYVRENFDTPSDCLAGILDAYIRTLKAQQSRNEHAATMDAFSYMKDFADVFTEGKDRAFERKAKALADKILQWAKIR